MKFYYIHNTLVNKLTIIEHDGAISAIKFGEHPEGEHKKSALINKAVEQLNEYFNGKRTEFDLPLSPTGTAFQLKVWEALKTIPYGETKSYGHIAKTIGNPKSSRAVGGANNKNPISIVVPCHRVIGSNGALVGYGGGLENKKILLELEKQNPLD